LVKSKGSISNRKRLERAALRIVCMPRKEIY
jgi:hypothetical protein